MPIAENLSAQAPGHLDWLHVLGDAQQRFGDLLQAEGNKEEALLYYRKSLKLRTRSVETREQRESLGYTYLMVGTSLANLGKTQEALPLLTKAAKLLSDNATDSRDFYNAACAHALAQDSDRAFAMLSRSIEEGPLTASRLAADSDLEFLHSDPRWPALLEQLNAKK